MTENIKIIYPLLICNLMKRSKIIVQIKICAKLVWTFIIVWNFPVLPILYLYFTERKELICVIISTVNLLNYWHLTKHVCNVRADICMRYEVFDDIFNIMISKNDGIEDSSNIAGQRYKF